MKLFFMETHRQLLTMFIVSSLLIAATSSNLYAEYKEGWTYKNFYAAVEKCRKSIVYPNAQAYENKGIANNNEKSKLDQEIISLLPVFDKMAADTCFCTINEIAKDLSYNE